MSNMVLVWIEFRKRKGDRAKKGQNTNSKSRESEDDKSKIQRKVTTIYLNGSRHFIGAFAISHHHLHNIIIQ